MIEAMAAAMTKFESLGFAGFSEDWIQHDWLQGRDVIVDLPDGQQDEIDEFKDFIDDVVQ